MINIVPLSLTQDSIHQEYISGQEALIPSILSSSLFNPETDYIVTSLETPTGDLLYSTKDTRFSIRNVPNTVTQESTPEVIVFPLEDLTNSGYNEGNYNIFPFSVYIFLLYKQFDDILTYLYDNQKY